MDLHDKLAKSVQRCLKNTSETVSTGKVDRALSKGLPTCSKTARSP